MIPNLNPAQMKKMMRQLGMKMDEIDATKVIIEKADGTTINIHNPKVVKMNLQGKDTFQITGDIVEGDKELEAQADEDDINLVAEQAGVSAEMAKKALEGTEGDLAKAILNLEEQEK